MLPNVLIIGAAKCGTTSLHMYLDSHPDVAMSQRKELRFFTRDDWRGHLDWYESWFADRPIRGESSPQYSMSPALGPVAERIHETVPDARLIYLVRDPVERAVASFVEMTYLLRERRPLSQALTDFDDPANIHIGGSKYATQLDQYLRLFDPGRILVIDQTDLRTARDDTMAEVFGFLGLPHRSIDLDREYNDRVVKVRYNRLGVWMMKHQIFAVRGGPTPRGPLRQPIRSLLSRPIDATLPADVHDRLVSEFAPEVERLRMLTGKRFDSWPNFPAP